MGWDKMILERKEDKCECREMEDYTCYWVDINDPGDNDKPVDS